MNLISLGFLLFAALTVLVYHMLPGRSKAPWLLLSSLFFYLCADPRCLLFLLASVAAVFFAARRMPMSRRPKALAAAALLDARQTVTDLDREIEQNYEQLILPCIADLA